jgi:hypothetical protein
LVAFGLESFWVGWMSQELNGLTIFDCSFTFLALMFDQLVRQWGSRQPERLLRLQSAPICAQKSFVAGFFPDRPYLNSPIEFRRGHSGKYVLMYTSLWWHFRLIASFSRQFMKVCNNTHIAKLLQLTLLLKPHISR